MSNQYSLREYSFDGEILTISEISERIGVPPDTIRRRLRDGMPTEKAFSSEDLRIERLKKFNHPVIVEYKGECLTITELSERVGIKRTTLMQRYRFGDRGEALWRPVEHEGRKRRAI